VTGRPSYSSVSPEAPAFEIRNGVQVHRVSIWFKGREHLTARIFGYLQFLWGAWWKARRLVKEESFDAVLTFHNPPFVGWLGATVASKHHIPFVYVLYDIHPDVLLATGWKLPWLLVKAWEGAHRYILGKATFVIVLGQAMKETLMKKGVADEKIITVPLWGRPELQPLTWEQVLTVRKELGIDEKSLLLLYAGNMGIMHPLDPLLDAAIALKGEPVYFLFIGEGVKRSQLVSRAIQEGLTRVAFLPYQPEERFAQIVGAADACFVVLQPGLERLAFPSRAFTFLSAGVL
jgi:colanic acid biosynthesis glycosyl transferase WcaI